MSYWIEKEVELEHGPWAWQPVGKFDTLESALNEMKEYSASKANMRIAQIVTKYETKLIQVVEELEKMNANTR